LIPYQPTPAQSGIPRSVNNLGLSTLHFLGILPP